MRRHDWRTESKETSKAASAQDPASGGDASLVAESNFRVIREAGIENQSGHQENTRTNTPFSLIWPHLCSRSMTAQTASRGAGPGRVAHERWGQSHVGSHGNAHPVGAGCD